MNREHRRSKDLKNTYLWVNREGHYLSLIHISEPTRPY